MKLKANKMSHFSRIEIQPRKSAVHTSVKIALTALFLFLIFIGAAAGAGILFEKKYSKRVYNHVYLGNNPVGGMNQKELEQLIGSYRKTLESQGAVFTYKNKKAQLFPFIITPDDPDLTYEFYSIDTDATIKELMRVGRTKRFFNDLKTKISLQNKSITIPLAINVSYENTARGLQENFKDLEIASQDAQLAISKNFTIIVLEEREGVAPNYTEAIASLETQLRHMRTGEIAMVTARQIPKVKASDLQGNIDIIQKLFKDKPVFTLAFVDKEWAIGKEIYKDWINARGATLYFDEEKFTAYIKENLTESIETPVQEARFEIKDGKVTEFKPSRAGRSINYQETATFINSEFFKQQGRGAPFVITTAQVEPKFTTETVNNFGIKEVIGKGVSNFKGSPVNRRHNIKVGADSLNGILVAPDEEFSLVQALGSIDAANGYLPELVIKGNRTIPEFGGGLCQIGTTLFRAALDSGLPITERRSHSYRVRYYEPAGTDCTIYNPHPDCRFKNDTGNYILIQTYMTEKDDLVFEFWGTKDGRSVVQTTPVIYNVIKPPSTKYIETEDLAPGQKKCTESAHDGADTTFDYTVTYKDGKLNEQTFASHYRPWQAICLIGKEKSAVFDSAATGTQNAVPFTP